MSTHEERLKILRMVEAGQITAEQAVKLMDALGRSSVTDSEKRNSASPVEGRRTSRWFRIRVTDMQTGKIRVDVRLPITLVSAGAKIGARFSPDVTGLNMDEMMELIQSGTTGRVFEVEQPQNEKVEIFIE